MSTAVDNQNQTPTPAALCARIQSAAIKCEDYHVFVNWMPHVAGLGVYVHPAGTVYQSDVRREYLLDETVYLDENWCDPIEGLTRIIDQLQRMGVEV